MRNSTLRRLTYALVLLTGAFAPISDGHAAADDCCIDLDQRIDELEALTARKGTRKVSLTVSGWVNEAMFAWDDGVTSDIYIGTNFVEQSRFRFAGDAKINKEWSAGYILEVGVQGHPSNRWD